MLAVDAARALLAAASAALTSAGWTVIREGLVAGEAVWDDCGCDGATVWAAVERKWPVDATQGWPAEGSADPCFAPVPPTAGADLVVGLTLCWPTVDDRGRAPSAAVVDAAAEAITLAGEVVWGALACALADLGDDLPARMQSFSPVGPVGGCVSAEVRVLVEVDSVVPAP